MRVVFMGTPDFAVGTLEALLEAGHEVVAVVTQPDKPKGRGKTLMPTPVKEAALARMIPVLQPKKVREPEFVETLRKIGPDGRNGCAANHLKVLGNAQIWMHQCARISSSGLPGSGADPVGCHQRG